MTRFTITCHCRRTHLKFISRAHYGTDIIEALYCPHCVEESPVGTFIVEVEGTRKADGRYGIIWHADAARYYQGKTSTEDNELYHLFGKKKLIFDFGSFRDPHYTILGFKTS